MKGILKRWAKTNRGAKMNWGKEIEMGMAEMVGGYLTGMAPPIAGGMQILKN